MKLRIVVFGSLCVLLTACGTYRHDYRREAITVAPTILPKDIPLKIGQNYYPIPQRSSATTTPSLLPPGSNLKRFDKKKKSLTAQSVAWAEDKGEPILVLPKKSKKAWPIVGRALAETRYQILDQDPLMNSYYMLDMSVTNNQITAQTPIYRVYLTADNQATQIHLLNQKNQTPSMDIVKRILGDLEKHLT